MGKIPLALVGIALALIALISPFGIWLLRGEGVPAWAPFFWVFGTWALLIACAGLAQTWRPPQPAGQQQRRNA